MTAQGHPTSPILRPLSTVTLGWAGALGKQLQRIAVKVPNTSLLVPFRLGGLHAKGKLRVYEF